MSKVAVLTSLTPVLFRGLEARKFLQGQLSSDVRRLAPSLALLGSCNSGQGRVQNVVTVLEREDGIGALFPTSTVERSLQRLRKCIYSTKVSLELAPWVLAPVSESSIATLPGPVPAEPGEILARGDVSLLRWWSSEQRYLRIMPAVGVDVDDRASALADLEWRGADLAAGLPQVYLETQASFVPQMLNLDLLSAISFDKGCYVGQEVVARARRGGVSRRMLRFTANCAAPAPGTGVLHGDVEAGEVVDALASSSGCQLLAVVSFEHASGALSLAGLENSELTRTSLPYQVPAER